MFFGQPGPILERSCPLLPLRHSEQLPQSHPSTFPTIQRRPDIQVKAQIPCILRWHARRCSGCRSGRRPTSVEVNDVSYLCSTSGDDPIMSIEGSGVSVIRGKRSVHLVHGILLNATSKNRDLTHPNAVFIQAFGVRSRGRPLKLTNLTPPHFSPPIPFSHFSNSAQALSFTAL